MVYDYVKALSRCLRPRLARASRGCGCGPALTYCRFPLQCAAGATGAAVLRPTSCCEVFWWCFVHIARGRCSRRCARLRGGPLPLFRLFLAFVVGVYAPCFARDLAVRRRSLRIVWGAAGCVRDRWLCAAGWAWVVCLTNPTRGKKNYVPGC